MSNEISNSLALNYSRRHQSPVVWQTHAEGNIMSVSTDPAQDRVFISDNDSTLSCFDLHSKEQLFKVKAGTIHHGLQFFEDQASIGHESENNADFLVAREKDGSLRWRQPWDGIATQTRPLLGSDGRVYALNRRNGGADRFLQCLDPESGELQWEYQYSNYPGDTITEPRPGVIAIHFYDGDGMEFIDAEKGEKIDRISFPNYFEQTVAPTEDGGFLVDCDDTLYRLDQSGNPVWKNRIHNYLRKSPESDGHGGLLVSMERPEGLKKIDAATGNDLWQLAIPDSHPASTAQGRSFLTQEKNLWEVLEDGSIDSVTRFEVQLDDQAIALDDGKVLVSGGKSLFLVDASVDQAHGFCSRGHNFEVACASFEGGQRYLARLQSSDCSSKTAGRLLDLMGRTYLFAREVQADRAAFDRYLVELTCRDPDQINLLSQFSHEVQGVLLGDMVTRREQHGPDWHHDTALLEHLAGFPATIGKQRALDVVQAFRLQRLQSPDLSAELTFDEDAVQIGDISTRRN